MLVTSFWDDWMRQPAQRQERACIRPEIPRTSTFGKVGVSKSVPLIDTTVLSVSSAEIYVLIM